MNTTRNYEISQTQEKTVYAPGRITNLSTAVAVNGVLPDNTIAQIREIVATATAYQPQRGDQISVMSMAFDRSYAAAAEAEMATAEQEGKIRARMLRYFAWGFSGLAVLAVIVFGTLWLMRHRATPVALTEAAATLEEIIPVEEFIVQKSPLIQAEEEARSKQGKIREIVKKQPEEAAALIKTWLAEE
jgi:flagellar M-ring protein FliF